MGVYIRGMEMPAGCSSCLFRRTDYLSGLPACTLIFEEIPDGVNWDEKLPECPLTEVPEPHGRLIDADALIQNKEVNTFEAVFAVAKTPTIIPASEEG